MDNLYNFMFRYKVINWEPQDQTELGIFERKRPNVQVLLEGTNGRKIKRLFLLDSGADHPFIDYELAQLLDYKLEGKTKVKTAGDDLEVYFSYVKMGLLQGKGHCKIGDKIHCYVFLEGKTDAPLIMGRDPLFDKFKIIIEQYDQKVNLRYRAHIKSRYLKRKKIK